MNNHPSIAQGAMPRERERSGIHSRVARGLGGVAPIGMIQNYDDFIKALLEAGFSMGGGSANGIYAVVTWGWKEEPPYDTPVSWHTEDPDTDPWEWRMRVLDERGDIAYAKLFFNKTGFITKNWYPYFLAARRGGLTFEEAYADGKISHSAKRVYDIVAENGVLPSHVIKQSAGLEKSAFDRALTELQMKMFLTICGRQQSSRWPSAAFCATERFFGDEVFEKAAKISKEDAFAAIREQILVLNPSAQDKKIEKFIVG